MKNIKKAIAMVLALIVVLALFSPLGLLPETAVAAQRIVENEKVTISSMVHGPPVGHYPDYIFTFTMPYDGVFNITARRESGLGGVNFEWIGSTLAGPIFHTLPLRNDDYLTAQVSLRAGEYTFGLKHNHSGRTYDVEFSFFISPALNTTWTGTVDREPNDTAATAIPLAPNTIATGNVNAQDIMGRQGVRDELDLYKFTLTSTSEVQIRILSIDGLAEANIVDANGGNVAVSGVQSRNDTGLSSMNITLPLGDYWIRVTGMGRDSRGLLNNNQLTAYEIEYRVLSGSAGETPPPPPPAETPSEPLNFTVAPGDSEAVLSWTPPANTGGNPILHFDVTRDGGSAWVQASSNTGHTFTGLSNGTSYSFGVRAVTSAGPGTASRMVSATPAPSVPPTGQLQNNMSNWAREEINRAHDIGIIPDSLLNPNVDYTRPITRAEFAGVAVKTYENMTGTQLAPAIVNPFSDTNSLDVLKAYNAGIMVGTSANTFGPNTVLNREQCATALTRVFKRFTIPSWSFENDRDGILQFNMPPQFADHNDISLWARESVYFMVANGIIQGMGNNRFAPRAVTTQQQADGYAQATREQAIVIALRMVENLG